MHVNIYSPGFVKDASVEAKIVDQNESVSFIHKTLELCSVFKSSSEQSRSHEKLKREKC